MSTNLLVILGIIAAIVVASMFVMLSNQTDEGLVAPGGNQNQKVIIEKGRITPKPVELNSKYPAILIFHNFSSEKHEIVIKKLDEAGAEKEEVRRFEIDPGESMNQRFSFKPGEYILYCVLAQGEHTHRGDGEETKIIVD